MPTMGSFLRNGHVGRRQRPADRGAAEHRRRLVQPRDRRLAGRDRFDQQHVPHQRPAVRQPDGRVRPERPAGRVDRPERRARRPEGRPGRVGRRRATPRSTARRSTSRRSSPAAAWRRTITSADRSTTRRSSPRFGLQFDHPGGLRGPGSVPGRGPDRRDRLDRTSRARTARPRRCACACSTSASTSTASTPTSSTAPTTAAVNYDRVLFSPHQERGRRASRTLRKGELADVKVKISGGALDGKTAGMLVKVEELDARPVRRSACSTRRSAGRSRPGRPGPASPASPATSRSTSRRRSRPRPPPTSRSSSPGIASEETYVEQGLYWATGHQPMLKYVDATPTTRTCSSPAIPTTDEFQHQFLGLVSPDPARTAPPTRPTTTSTSTASRTAASRSARRSSARAYEGADETLRARAQPDRATTR